MLTFNRVTHSGQDRIAVEIHSLVIAGWTGRDAAAIEHHIEELAAIGVPRPSSVPVYYRVTASLLTQSDRLAVLGSQTSGEVEPVVVSLLDGLWLGLGSDHTDRKAETMGIALSKQLCGKPIGHTLWKLDEVVEYWDEIEMRAHAVIDGERTLYQQGKLAALRTPQDLILIARRPDGLPAGTAMFCGTLGAIGGIRPASRFEMELVNHKTGRRMSHAYDVTILPVIA